MSTEEAARGAVGLPRGGPEESEGGPAAASAAAAEPLALAGRTGRRKFGRSSVAEQRR